MSDEIAQRRFLPWLFLLFFWSGCAALIYEIIWLQLLELVIGASGVSLGVLLGTFMGGMCLGSLLLPRLISSRNNPLAVYALLEAAIGIIGILALFGIPIMSDFYSHLHGHGVWIRALVSSVCLMPPTIMMGATLPIASRFVASTPEGVTWMGLFYTGNLAGSVLGCLSAGFFLLRFFDMHTATYVAAFLNFSVAVAAACLARRCCGTRHFEQISPCGRPESSFQSLVLLAIALSGFCALGAEVVWTRLLSLLLGGTVYSFSIILAVYLIGLGLGSGAGSFISRTLINPRAALGFCQIALAGAIAWAAFMISCSLPYWPINPGMYTNDCGPWHIFQLDFLRTAWMVLPGALLWGASFPLAIAAIAGHGHDPGRMVGAVYAANTIGAILGALGFSLFIIPQLGTQWAQRLLIIVSAVTAVAAFLSFILQEHGADKERSRRFPLSFSRGVLAAFSLIVIAFLADTVSRIPWTMVAWGRFAATYTAQAFPDIIDENGAPPKNSSPSQWYCTYMGEGINVSVAVTKNSAGTRFFHGAGKVQASSLPQDMRLQRMLGHLSAITCKNPDRVKDVLVVACGAGVTAGSFIPYPNIRRIVICDIEPLVPKVVAPMFGRENYHVVDGIDKHNPHFVNGKEVSVIYDDGRHFIRTLPEEARFDIITSDPIDPWVKGSAALNTVEYYEMCKKHLKPGGVMSLWMPLYESNITSARSLIATFFKVFPNGLIFSNDEHLEGYDAVLIGQAESTQINVDRLQALLDRADYENVRESLAQAGFGGSSAWPERIDRGVAINLLSTFAGQASDLHEWIKDAQINCDKNLRLQYLAGMYFNSYQSTKILQSILSYYTFPDNVFVGSAQYISDLKEALMMQGRNER
ncbi:MAG: fused MFS/spermidine synthase [Acidobacteria bacterium]|nr:fused MFS/spermidine synthase [Acidobacteriota bacterium]